MNQSRLVDVLSLAIKTLNYQDVPYYFDFYTAHETPKTLLSKTIRSALSVSGKYFLYRNHPEDAFWCFSRALEMEWDKNIFLNYIIEALKEFGLKNELEMLLTKQSLSEAV